MCCWECAGRLEGALFVWSGIASDTKDSGELVTNCVIGARIALSGALFAASARRV